jgi:uncharacterized damage-inducible protein DinB
MYISARCTTSDATRAVRLKITTVRVFLIALADVPAYDVGRKLSQRRSIMKLRVLLTLCCLLFSASYIYGQGTPPAQTPDAATELRNGFTEVSGWVTKAAEMVPEDKYNYRPVDTVRTFGQLVAHIADSYNYYCARGAGNNVEWSDAIEKGNTDKATLVPKLKQALDRCTEVYKGNSGRVGPLLGNVGHTSLHYGNIITYMRMLGMKPPSS